MEDIKILRMEPVFVAKESDLKKWVKEAVKEYFHEHLPNAHENEQKNYCLLNRKEIAQFLRISLVTLTDWTKRGLPSHQQRGRVYFDKNEVLDYIKDKKIKKFKIGSKLYNLRNEIESF